ncbi:MAG: GntR family transcriptional regulator [Chloroflexi bacterium]|nr:GntR family transcriptional regulator [Chloroflexota bacterium]
MPRLALVPLPRLVEPSSPVPLYFQVANVLQARIFAGSLQPGALIGTEKQLAAEFGVSRITIRKALEVLRADGLLKVERGLGTFVADDPRPVAPTALHVFLDDILARGETLQVIQDEQSEVAAPAEVAHALGVRSGTKVLRIKRHMIPPDRNDERAGVWVTYFLTRETWRLVDMMRGRGSVLQAVDRAPGLRLTQGHEVIRAIAADNETAAWLEVPPGFAILRIERHYQTASGRTVVYGWADRAAGATPVLLSRTER